MIIFDGIKIRAIIPVFVRYMPKLLVFIAEFACVYPGSSEKQCCGKPQDNFHARNFHRTGWQCLLQRELAK